MLWIRGGNMELKSIRHASSSQNSARGAACTRSAAPFRIQLLVPLLLPLCGLLLFCRPAVAQLGTPANSPSPEPARRKDTPTLSELTKEINGGETHSYRISLTAGQFLY